MQPKRIARCGVVALIMASTQLSGQTFSTIYSFGRNKLGSQPASGVVIGTGGILFGTTLHGGLTGLGVAYELLPPVQPGGAWTEIALHSFGADGSEGSPGAGLTLGSGGALYGVTLNGTGPGSGTAFRLIPWEATGNAWPEVTLHAFTGPDGAEPKTPLTFGREGVLYGATSTGTSSPAGTVYSLTPVGSSGTWSQQVLHDFTGYDGQTPTGPLAVGTNGAIYGATLYGASGGVIYQVAPPTQPGGAWTESTVHAFQPLSADESYPTGAVLGQNGVLYGTAMGTPQGYPCGTYCGTVFQLSPPAAPEGTWTEAILHTFTGVPNGDGSQPNSPPIIGPGGVLYGTTLTGGAANSGTIYELLPPSESGGDWTEVVLYSFTGGADGWEPNSVTLGPDGNLYGTTELGGVSSGGIINQGTVFQVVLQ
jgi:uncharacterized repeat protein (TIGR03803 family)